MDRRQTGPEKSGFLKDLEEGGESVEEEFVEENGEIFRVPYRIVKEVTFNNIKKEELIDLEHSARLQYELLLLEPVLRAQVSFVKRSIYVMFNPPDAKNRKPKISLEELKQFLESKSVHVDISTATVNEVDYYKEVYSKQYNPAQIREHPPYGYTKEEWEKIKEEWNKKKALYEKRKMEKFAEFQNNYLLEHPDLAKELNIEVKQKKQSLFAKIFKKKQEKEKGFWFHGV
ncbi:MAG: hypothetical protein QXL16_00115 [Candidatus Micrarchaeaceae archaeon]